MKKFTEDRRDPNIRMESLLLELKKSLDEQVAGDLSIPRINCAATILRSEELKKRYSLANLDLALEYWLGFIKEAYQSRIGFENKKGLDNAIKNFGQAHGNLCYYVAGLKPWGQR